MEENRDSSRTSDEHSVALPLAALLAGLCLTRFYSYLLFHGAVELFTIAVAVSVFFLAWNTRRFLDNHYLLFVGIASLFIAVIDTVHALAYKGMGIFPGHGANLPTQFWIAGRYLQSLSFLIAPFFLRRKLKPSLMFGICSGAVLLVFLSIAAGVFPDCFVEGAGLTQFKVISEYAVILILLASLAALFRHRAEFDGAVLKWLAASIALSMAAELAFTLYDDVYGAANMIGHVLRFLSFCLIYRAIIVTGLISPYDLLFRNLAQSEEALRRADQRHRAFLGNSSEGICRIELEPPLDVTLPDEEQVRHIVEHARVAECNDAFARLHGLPGAAEIVGATLAQLPQRSDEIVTAFVRSRYQLKEMEACNPVENGSVRCLASSFTGVVENGYLIRAWGVERDVSERKRAAMERERLISELQRALAEVKTLSGLLPICANCKKIRDDKGYWTQVELYVEARSDASFSHGICPGCLKELYPEYCPECEHENG